MDPVWVSGERLEKMKGGVRGDAHLTAGAGENNSQLLSGADMEVMMDETLRAIQHKYVTRSWFSTGKSK